MHLLRAGGDYLARREQRAWIALAIVGLLIVAVTLVAFRGVASLGLTAIFIPLILMARPITRALKTILQHLHRFQQGRVGEQAVTQLLAQLSNSYYLINDVVLGHGNIDHVLVGPCGIVIIETKRVRGDIRCRHDAWWVNGHAVKSYSRQAKAGAMRVREILAREHPELKSEFVRPMVAFAASHCRLQVDHAEVAVVRFSELLALTTEVARQRQMDGALAQRAARTLAASHVQRTG